MTIIDFREVLIDILSNQDIMSTSNLLFYDDNDPHKIHPRNCEIGEIITSDVFFNTHKRLCNNKSDVLFPLILYNNEINFDKYSKLKLDPFSMTFGRLPVKIRNQPNAWRYFGFIPSVKQFETDTHLDGRAKMNIYHKCIKELLTYIKLIQSEGGISFELTLQNGSKHNVKLMIYIQFVIGDTKGHDMLCGCMGSHHLNMKQLV